MSMNPKAPEKCGEISQQINLLGETITRLEAGLVELRKRLEPVSTATAEKSQSVSACAPCTPICDIASIIRSQRDRVESLALSVERTFSEIEI